MRLGQQTADEREAGQVGNVSAADAWHLLEHRPETRLVDVRTTEEWEATGIPDLLCLNKNTICLSWRLSPDYSLNPAFAGELAEVIAPGTPLLFLCKVGGRSLEAACFAVQSGYPECYNIVAGYEGGTDALPQMPAGWKASGLPWRVAA